MTRAHFVFGIVLLFASTSDYAIAGADAASTLEPNRKEVGWITLFNGNDLSGWKASENKGSFKVTDGKLVVKGDRSHLFYEGPVNKANFKNFEWKCDILTKPDSNSGMYIHTKYQEEGWPKKGYEIQVNNTHGDPRKTGGLYAIADVMDRSPVTDNQWFTQHVTVRDKRIVVRVNGKVTADYNEPENAERSKDLAGRLLSSGTIAIQGHDPGSEVHYRNIKIRILP